MTQHTYDNEAVQELLNWAKKMIENYIMQLGETTGTEYQITWKYE